MTTSKQVEPEPYLQQVPPWVGDDGGPPADPGSPRYVGVTITARAEKVPESVRPIYLSFGTRWLQLLASVRDLLANQRKTALAAAGEATILVDKALDSAARAGDRALDAVRSDIAAAEHAIARAVGKPPAFAAEIRERLSRLPEKERRALLDSSEPDILRSVIDAPAFLSGIGEQERTLLRKQLERAVAGEHVKRLAQLREATEVIVHGHERLRAHAVALIPPVLATAAGDDVRAAALAEQLRAAELQRRARERATVAQPRLSVEREAFDLSPEAREALAAPAEDETATGEAT